MKTKYMGYYEKNYRVVAISSALPVKLILSSKNVAALKAALFFNLTPLRSHCIFNSSAIALFVNLS